MLKPTQICPLPCSADGALKLPGTSCSAPTFRSETRHRKGYRGRSPNPLGATVVYTSSCQEGRSPHQEKTAFKLPWPWKGPKSKGKWQNKQGGTSHLPRHLPLLGEGITQLSRRPKGKRSQIRAQQELLLLDLSVTCGLRLALSLTVTVSSRIVKMIREAKGILK